MLLLTQLKKTFRQLSGWSQLKKKIRPEFNFENQSHPAKPDYRQLKSWVAHPDIKSKVSYTPQGVKGNEAWKEGEVDCFFIYPTLLFSNKMWNAPIDHASTNELVEEMIMPGQVSVFNSCSRIFAPRYRQATFYSFLGSGKNGRKALELALTDVLDAFEYYLKHFNQGRPFILAGHSQGALMTMGLLEKRIEGTDLVNRMVAAYPIGFWFANDKFGRTLKTIKPSNSPVDHQCVVAWDTYLNTGKPMRLLDKAEILYYENEAFRWVRRSKKKPLGINPLSWNRETSMIGKEANKGAVHLILDTPQRPDWTGLMSEDTLGMNCTGLSHPHVGEVAAQLGEDGFLYISHPQNWAFKTMILPGGNMHMFDYALFYMNLRENVKRRWEMFSGNGELKMGN